MVSPRYRKLLRDLRTAQGRVLMMVIAIAVGIFGVGSMLSAYAILSGELNRNYLSTNPASASFALDKADDSLVDAVRQRPGIADAEACSIVVARIEKKKDDWLPLLLFVVRDFNNMRISTVKHESGAWPPPKGSMLLERNALTVINAKVGDVYRVKTPSGQKHEVRISGSVHDPGMAPSWQEQTAYGYITPSTLSWLGENNTLQILKVTVKDQPLNTTAINHTVKDLAGWLKQKGHTIGEIRIPPPGTHPHQHLMETVLMMLIIFSLMALLLSAILTATMVRGLLAQQVRQIGIMKAIGARSRQIAVQYLMLIALVGVTAVMIGLPLGIAAGRGFSRMMAELLNIRLYSEGVSAWVYVVLILSGVLVPLMVALGPIFRATQVTVREVLNDYGVSRKAFDSRRLFTLLGKIRGLDRTLLLAIRNTFRRRGRLLLTLGLLAAAGGMFITSLNVKTAWEHYLQDAVSNHDYDLEIRFNHPEPQQKAMAITASVPGVRKVESWSMAPAAVDRLGGFAAVRDYPAGGGLSALIMRSVPPKNKMLGSQLLEGRRLRKDDINATVLNHMSKAVFPNVKAGDSITLVVNGKPVTLRVVGILLELLTPPTAYVSPLTFTKTVGYVGQSTALRVAIKRQDAEAQNLITRDVERALQKENVSVKTIASDRVLDGAKKGHIYVFIFALILMATVMAIVGALGLMSSMSTSVIERTREFGVMRTIGGTSRTILRNVILEGIFIGLMSWIIAIALSLPLTAIIGRTLGNLAFRSSLPLVISPSAVGIWLTIIVLGAIAASTYPAWKASRLTVRETLAYV